MITMSWQLLTTLSVLTLSASVLLQRVLLHKDKIDPFAYAVTFQAIVGALLMVAAVINGFTLAGISSVYPQVVISVMAFGGGHILYAKTLQLIEASAFSVLFATQAIWIMLIGVVLFHEALTLVQILGTVLIFSGVGLIIKNWHGLKLDKGTMFGLLTGFVFGIAVTCWSYVGRNTDGLSWAAISFFGTSLAALAFKPSSRLKITSLLSGNVLAKLLILGILYGIGSLTMLLAYKLGTFSVVTPLRQTSIVVTTIISLLFLRTERTRIQYKIAAAIISFIGALLIII